MATIASRLPRLQSHNLSLDTGSRDDKYPHHQRRISPISPNSSKLVAAGPGKLSRTTSYQSHAVRAPHPDANDDDIEDADDELEGLVSRANTAGSSPILPRTASTFSETSQPQISRSGLLKRYATTDASGNLVGGQKQEKKKAVSFISRFLSTNKKRTWTLPTSNERTSIDNDPAPGSLSRTQSMENPEIIDNIEFSPRILQPTGYTKVKSKNKRTREFDKLFLAQELRIDDTPANNARARIEKTESPDQNAVWAIAFSRDGKFLAAAGQNRIVKVWSVLSSLDERDVDDEENEEPSSRPQLRAAVFKTAPVRMFTDHDGPVLDLSWSKNNFLLTTSQDKTVRLFHPSRAECLCTFKHASQVHSIAFHPKDDRFFLAGCKDGKLRLWSIPDKRVEYSANVNDMITAVTFSPDGKTSMAGTMNGNISIFTTEELKYSCHFLARGKKKCRVTSIQARHVPVGSDSIKLLVTTADSRIQLYNLRDKGLELKIKGHKNEEVAMSASINDDGRYIISGSEDKSVYIWSLTDTNDLPNLDKNKDKTIQRPMEFFEANTTKTTCAVMAPREARMILNGSGDPIYDICNPPPVKLVEREGSIASSTRWNGSNASINGGNLPKPNYTKSMPVEQSPALSQSAHFEDYLPTMTSSATFSIEDPTKSAAYNMRASHTTGHIIVTASTSGIIRVYRQDCAATKRAKALDLDPYARRAALRRAFTGATPSSRSSMSAPNGTRPVSVRSFKGARTPSIRSFVQPNRENRLSTTTGHGELVTRAKRAESSASSNHQPTRDRIERWRDDIDGVADSASSLRRTNSMHSATSASMVTANESPVKSRTPLRSSVASVTSGAALRTRADSGDTTNSAGVKSSVSGMPTSSSVDSPSRPGMVGTDGGDERGRRSSSFANPLHLQNGQSFMFWNVSQYEKPTSSTEAERPSASTRVSRQSGVSKLTSEESFDELDEDDEDDEEEDEAIRILKQKCPRCSGLEFTIKESRAWGFGKVKSVVCQQCGLERKNSGST